MHKNVYNLIVTVCIVLGLGAALIYEPGGESSWIVLVAAVVIGLTSAVTYLANQILNRQDGKRVIPSKSALGPTEGDAALLGKPEERQTRYGEFDHTVMPGEALTEEYLRSFLSVRWDKREYRVSRVRRLFLEQAASREDVDVGILTLNLWSPDWSDSSRMLQKQRYSDVTTKLSQIKWMATLDDVHVASDVRGAERMAYLFKWSRYKHGVRREAAWFDMLVQEELVEERSKRKMVY